jgi:putative zinc finger protein
MEHHEAREMLSARADGELDPSAVRALDDHLDGCAMCRAFGDGLPGLHALAVALPRVREPERLWAGPPATPVRARRRSFRFAPAFAAAVVVALVLTILGPPGRFTLPIAAAAEPLTTIRTMIVEREITDNTGVTHEKIWFRAPGFVRIERTSPMGSELIIERPGERFTQNASGSTHLAGLPPDADILPEPLSPTIALLGDPKGAGPTIDGRETIRYDLSFDNSVSRTAYVDATRFTVLGLDQSLILDKLSTINGRTTGRKRVVSVQLNTPIDPSRFAVPSGPTSDAGFRSRPVSSFAVVPAAIPAGFALVQSGSSPDGDTALYARGAFPLQIDVAERARATDERTTHLQTATIGGVTATIVYSLYSLPRIYFTLHDKVVTITAPLGRDGLVDAARTMFAL